MYFPGGLIGIVYLVRDQLLSLAWPRPSAAERRADPMPARATGLGRHRHRATTVCPTATTASALRRRASLGALRRHRGSRRREHRGRARRGRRTHRRERRGQVDAHERDQRLRPEPGPVELLGHDISRRVAGTARPRRPRPHVPSKPICSPTSPSARRSPVALEAHERTVARRHRARTSRATDRTSTSKLAEADELHRPRSDSGATRTRSSASSPPAPGASPSSRASSPSTPGCSASTNPPPASRNARPKPSGHCCSRIRAELDATMLVIEHDMPLIMSISDRVYCLEAGTGHRRGHAGRRARRPARDRVVPRHRRTRDPPQRRGAGAADRPRGTTRRRGLSDRRPPARRMPGAGTMAQATTALIA